jgi:SpoVK/Ycf46/Vps4 family AAA+-type ATPase
VYIDWGFEKKLSLGKGLNILFAGESGTGKTMAAEIVANELHLDLYKIDLSSIVSKYIGETEKNIDQIFKEAEASNAILFFDEADAIFGKRSEIKDSHDRYSNIEVNYLLQKLEDHREIVILASNLAKNIDSAFVRRMQFWIEFPFPEEQNRLVIWKNMFPEKAPRSEDVDFEFLARQFNITGGAIKNIVLTGAFLAAEESSPISLRHLIMATKREYEKMGRPILRSDFGKYYDEAGYSSGSTTMQRDT